jgi:hypothetical protein
MHEDTWAGFRRLGNGLEAGWKREILGVVEANSVFRRRRAEVGCQQSRPRGCKVLRGDLGLSLRRGCVSEAFYGERRKGREKRSPVECLSDDFF